MPTEREREYYAMGYRDGRASTIKYPEERRIEVMEQVRGIRKKSKRKLSAWNKFVKANSKKPRFRYRNGKLNLKKMAVAFRKTPAGRKKKRR
jgi:hypothetical protein